MPNDRAPGFYWVRQHPDDGDEWVVAYWGISTQEKESDYEPGNVPPRMWWTAGSEIAGGDDLTFASIGVRCYNPLTETEELFTQFVANEILKAALADLEPEIKRIVAEATAKVKSDAK